MNSIKISEHMNHQPVKFKKNMPIAQAVELFINKQQFVGPFVNDDVQVIAFLSEKDCLASMLQSTYLGESHSLVEDKMRTDVLTVSPNDTIVDIANLMMGDKPKIYPVVDENNVLLGVITRHAVLSAIDAQLNSNYQKGHARLV